MKKLLVVISSVALLAIAGASFARISSDQLKIGVVNVQKILKESPSVTAQINAIRDNLKKQFEPMTAEMTKMQSDLKASVDQYTKSTSVMTDKQKKALQDKIMAQQEELQKKTDDFQTQFTDAQNKAMQKILDSIDESVGTVAKKNHYDLVLHKSSVAYSDPEMDITDLVLIKLK